MAEWRRPGNENPLIHYVKHTQPTNATEHTHVDGRCLFHGFEIRTDGKNDVIVNVYDGQAEDLADRLTPDSIVVPASQGTYTYFLPKPVMADDGIHISIVCAGSDFSHRVFFDN